MRKKESKISIQKGKFLVLLFSCYFLSCEYFQKFFIHKELINSCDPSLNYYESDQHYISDDLLNFEGKMNYKKVIENQKTSLSPCDPLYKSK